MQIFPFLTRRKAASIVPQELARLLADGKPVVLVDIRSEKEYADGHLPGAIHMPLAELESRAAELDPSAFIVFY
jgi:Rhodanese-related sulfurtransferase